MGRGTLAVRAEPPGKRPICFGKFGATRVRSSWYIFFMGGKLSGSACAVLVACALPAGCGGGNDRDGDSATTAAPARDALERPLYPRCGTAGFAKPRVRRLSDPEAIGPVWSLQYSRPASAGRPPQTVLIVQTSPSARASARTEPDARKAVIAGRQVMLRMPSRRFPGASAVWRTSRASYSVIATRGEPSVIRRFIACLP